MRRTVASLTAGSLILIVSLVAVRSCTRAHPVSGSPLDPAEIFRSAGFQGEVTPETGSIRIEVPRPGLKVRVSGAQIPGGLGLLARIDLAGTRKDAILMADFPLLEDEVNQSLRLALKAGFTVTALDNAFVGDTPRILTLHFVGHGDGAQLAAGAGSLLKAIFAGKTRAERNEAAPDLTSGKLDPGVIERYLRKGRFVDGAYRIDMGRATYFNGRMLGESAGMGSWAAFAGSNEHAMVDGEMAMLEYEVSDVLRAMIREGLRIVSIHTHLMQEKPRIMFIHYQGTGKLDELVEALSESIENYHEEPTSK